MPTRSPVHLVIDACVARACGSEDATYPTSKNCRDFLFSVLTICHQVVMTPQVYEEWKTHQSGSARRWRLAMLARKKIRICCVAANRPLLDELARVAFTENELAAILKDMRLIEAAMSAGNIVVSLDEEVRSLLQRAAERIGQLRQIAWVNPDREADNPLEWLENGAQREAHRLLGYEQSAE